jgi:hypothetical protein
MIATCAGLAARGARSATIEAGNEGVTYRSLLKTRRWHWSEIARFEARDGVLSFLPYRRRILWIALCGRSDRKLEDLNCRRARDGQSTLVDNFATELNDAHARSLTQLCDRLD